MPPNRFEDKSEAEKEEQRARYRELLEELRTVLPGVQVLFAFLLTAAFSQRFTELDDLAGRAYAGALLGAGLAAVTLMAPAAIHRLGERKERAERLALSIAFQVTGMTLLLVSMSLAIFVVARFIFDNNTSIGIGFGVAIAAVGGLLWYVLPVLTRETGNSDRDNG